MTIVFRSPFLRRRRSLHIPQNAFTAFAAAAFFTCLATQAMASGGCAYVNTGALSGTKTGLDGTVVKTFKAGDVLSVTLTLTGAAHLQVGSTVVNNASGTTKTYTFPADGSYTIYWDARTAASAVYGVSCAPVSNTTSEPPPSVQATISRSQSEVVASNVNSRVTAIGSNVGVFRVEPGAGRTTPGTGRTSPGGDAARTNLLGSMTAMRHPFQGAQDASWSSVWASRETRSVSARDLALQANFDSSKTVLAAVPTDGTTDPVTGPRLRAVAPSEHPLTVWGHGSFSNADNSRNDAVTDSRYHGDVWGYNLGADYRFNDKFYAGASVGYSHTGLATGYNAGSYDENSWTFTPYAVYMPTDRVKLSAMAGYATSKIDLTRDSGGVTGNTKSHMWYGAVDGSYDFKAFSQSPLDFKAHLGLLATNKVVGAYSESDASDVGRKTANTRQVKPGVEAAYTFDVQGYALQPYVAGDLVYDFIDPTNGDNSAFVLGGGMRVTSSDARLSGSLNAQTQAGRTNYQEYTVSGLIAYDIPLQGANAQESGTAHVQLQSAVTPTGLNLGTGVTYLHGSMPLSVRANVGQEMLKTGGRAFNTTVGAELTF